MRFIASGPRRFKGKQTSPKIEVSEASSCLSTPLPIAEVLLSEFVVTFDGTAGCGKSTVAKKVARRLNCLHLNSGMLFRALASAALERKLDLSSGEQMSRLLESLDFQFVRVENYGTEFRINGENPLSRLLSEDIAEAASLVAVLPDVRAIFFKLQRKIYERERVLVVEGRDSGTEVFPHAQAKYYLDAALPIRASRRLAQMKKHGMDLPTFDEVLGQIDRRDSRDRSRPIAPQRPAHDASLVDTARLSATQIARTVIAELEDRGWIRPVSQ